MEEILGAPAASLACKRESRVLPNISSGRSGRECDRAMGNWGVTLQWLPQPLTRKRGSRGSCNVVPWVRSLWGSWGRTIIRRGAAAEESRRRSRCARERNDFKRLPQPLMRKRGSRGLEIIPQWWEEVVKVGMTIQLDSRSLLRESVGVGCSVDCCLRRLEGGAFLGKHIGELPQPPARVSVGVGCSPISFPGVVVCVA